MVIVFDTETTNGIDDPLCYDISWAILDEEYNIIETRSFVVADIFLNEPQLMNEAYFAEKIPQYWADIADGKRILKRFKNIKKIFKEDCLKYNVTAIIAHNAPFDYRSCQTTQRFLTSSKYRYFFPYDMEIWDTLTMARQVFGKDENYINFCKDNGYCYGKDKPRLTAEILYKYLTNNLDFEEKHTGLEDVMIEKEIYKYCMEHSDNIKKSPWRNDNVF